MKFNIKEILTQLDKEAEDFIFPMLDNGYYYHGDQKLTIYRDAERWAMSIEVLAYNNHDVGVEGLTTHVSTFGNCILTKKPNDNLFSFAKVNQIQTFLEDYELYISFLNPEAHSIKVKEEIVSVIHDRQHYLLKGIELEYPDKILNYEFMRGLIPNYSNLFWVTRNEIANKIPFDLPVLMTLKEWHHPDLADGQKPSETEAFNQLSAVISTGDISFYSPTENPNTHWKNWPEGGAL